MREIQLSPTRLAATKRPHSSKRTKRYRCTTCPAHGDPHVAINVQQGLARLRQPADRRSR
ncbi:hypothetical protein ACNKHQ_23675 [Shigella flexneri]